jgi:SAM-dependent methyltransferase
MASAEAFSLSYPLDARRPFGHEDALRRLAKGAKFTTSGHILHLRCGAGAGTVLLARELGCRVMGADDDAAALAQLQERAKANNLADRVQGKVIDFKKLPFPEAEFDGIIADGGLPMNLETAAKTLRRHLAPKGRLCLVHPVRVGRVLPAALGAFWEGRLKEALRLPREALQVVEQAGYEPQSIETLPEVELDDFYQALEAHLGTGGEATGLREEISMHRSQSGNAAASFALIVARRKEPGERPPPSRSEG